MAQEFGLYVYFPKDIVGGCVTREKKKKEIHVVMGTEKIMNGQGNCTF